MVDDWQTWISGYLEPALTARIGDIEVELASARSMALGELIYAWRLHVAKLVADLSASSDDRSIWGAHDYIAALVIRDAVARGLERLDSISRKDVERVAGEVDSNFKDYVEDDVDGCTERIIGRLTAGLDWWWAKVPRRGPVRKEIEEYYGHESRARFHPVLNGPVRRHRG